MTVQVNTDLCIGCGRCVEACPAGAITIDESIRKAVIDSTLCTECGACIERCRKGALSINSGPGGSIKPVMGKGAYPSGNERFSSSFQRGQGRGRGGSGRGCGYSSGERPEFKGVCYCPVCDKTMPHKSGVPCSQTRCPFCGNMMIRK